MENEQNLKENEQNVKMGRFISELRKSQGLTQKDLAERLNVTDKAVSKWERGISYPDVGLILPLAGLLGVTAGELLSGGKNIVSDEKKGTAEEEKEGIVEEALRYSGRSTAAKVDRIRNIMFAMLSAALMIAALVCFICDFCISGKLTWSLIAALSLLFSWFLFLPLCRGRKGAIRNFLLVLSIAVIPYLAVLSFLLGETMVFKLGACVSVISIVWIWCVYALVLKMKHRPFRLAGVILLFCVLLNQAVNRIVVWMVNHEPVIEQPGGIAHRLEKIDTGDAGVIVLFSSLILAVICFSADFCIARIKRAGKEL